MDHFLRSPQSATAAVADPGLFQRFSETFCQSDFMPHGHCYLWKPALVGAHVLSDLVIGLSYLSIAATLYLLVRKVRIPYSSMVLAFGLFIGACGATHFMDIWNLWFAHYWVSAWVKVLTAGASVSTAFWLIKERNEIRSVAEAAKLARQKHLDLEEVTKNLEQVIQERTLELEHNRQIAQKQREELRTITDALPSLVAYIDRDRRYRMANAAFENWFNVPVSSIIGKSVVDVIGEEAYQEVESLITKALEGEVQTFEKELTYKNGITRFVSGSCMPRRNSTGEVNGFILLANDLSDLMMAHQEVKESERRLALALEVSSMGIWEWDRETRQTVFDDRTAKIMDLSRKVQDPFSPEMREALHPDDREKVLEHFWTAIGQNTDFNCEFRVLDTQGDVRWILARGRPRFESGDLGQRMLGVVMDITERKTAEQKLAAAMSKAEAANQAKSEFLANMSHEIRTPLGAVLGFAELMKDPHISNTERARYAEIVDRNGKQLSHLINDILDLSKVEAGKLEIEHTVVSLRSLIAEAASVLRPFAASKGIHLRIVPSSEIPERICTDPTRLNQILLNVIGNAIKFTQEGEVTVQVQTRRELPNGYFELAVRIQDTGIGLSPEHQRKLFRPFTQADSSMTRRFGGTGLGLVLSKHLAIALGGNLTLVESRLGRGSLFELVLLAATPDSCTHHTSAADTPKTAPDLGSDLQPEASERKPLRILVAEDSPDNQLLIGRMLSSFGCRIEFAETGDAAVEKAMSGNFDLVLMDIQMPVKDGHEATRELRARGFEKPIIALTAHALNEERKRSLEVGCNDHVTKPLTKKKLFETIERFA